ncbi:Pr6Pr family membrane protein [Cognatishimia sp.]|uniref:Pr6Pr family membrane protein n=1 Tax=Cognatishimia sp. TaxID=2211648 RepID=UPI00351556B3
MQLTQFERACAAVIAIAALGAQVIQTGLDLSDGMGLLESLWRQARYFTVLMVVTTGVTFAAMALRNAHRSAGWMTAVTSWIVMVGIVYHALLAADHNPTGIRAVINEIQHTAVPIATLVFWAMFSPKAGLSFKAPLVWVACPLGYSVYAMIRGLFDGKFPYFFLNPETTGWLGVLAYMVGLGALFYVAGALMVLASRRAAR